MPKSSDWITRLVQFTDGNPSPEIFRRWAAIVGVAAALERRVYLGVFNQHLYANMYVMLVAPPAIGKSLAINPIGRLWRETQKLYIAPDSVTKASLIDCLEKADRKIVIPGGTMLEYHSLACCVSELGVLMSAHDLEFMSNLNNLYDNPPSYRETRRTLNRSIDISNPQLNLLCGTQPAFLSSFLPEEAWGSGLMSRMVMVYAGTSQKTSLFGGVAFDLVEWKALREAMTGWVELRGQGSFTIPASKELERLYLSDIPPVPQHSKLEHYRGRRILTLLKLSLVSAVSRTGTIVIDLEDVERAKGWLLEAESFMPDIFRQMVGKSDMEVVKELHFYAFRIYAKDKKPLAEAVIYHFLGQRAPSEKIPKIIELAERSHMLVRTAGTNSFIPKPVHEHGME